MFYLHSTECVPKDLMCEIQIHIEKESLKTSKFNCDLWINENILLFNWDNVYKKIKCSNKFDVKDLKSLIINYNRSASDISFEIPCLPSDKKEKVPDKKYVYDNNGDTFDILKMKKITDTCILKVDGVETPIETSYNYGFNGNYFEDTTMLKTDLKPICQIRNPSHKSAIDRFCKRERDEYKDFSQDQYKLNFIELQVPDGHENPMNYTFNLNDSNLSSKEEYTLKTICSKSSFCFNEHNRQRIDNELIGILLAICYDVRTNGGEQNCESAWTRTILSPALSYFEPTLNLESAIEIFCRRSLIYPLYRNYDLGRLCVEDAIHALQKGFKWILKQLILTYYSFLECEDSRQLLNKYFIEDYIIYVNTVATPDNFKFLAKNLKNSFLRVSKKSLRLQLLEIETELLKELISDIHLTNSDDSDDENESSSDDEIDNDLFSSDDETNEKTSGSTNNKYYK
ncbi:protein SHQ1 homolog [Condylostylus longicornis]|uniref:protein SHQ1 homolog n=1 Tax=Condylostylus longicornis TaxID=2530218 RepID=UPI00244DA1F6|nr:protein SHQ1 homolog [Condylostylus longicornis]